MNENSWYKLFFLLAGVFFIIGLLMYLFRNSALSIGKLPGDFLFEGKGIKIYIPLVSSILISVILSLILYFVRKWL